MVSEVLRSDYETLIFTIRGRKVMVDYDLALLYGIPTKVLKQQVRRNQQRFPEDFMFHLSDIEKEQLVTNCDRLANLKHSSVAPLGFTEQGVAMLSSVINSDKAIKINIEIMRAFARYRAFLRENQEIKDELRALDKKFTLAFLGLLKKLDEMHQKKTIPRTRIGFMKDEL